MELLKVDTLEEAREKIEQVLQDTRMRTEYKSLLNACGCTLAEDVYAPCMVPGFTRSTVDGYAVHSADTGGAAESLPVFLKIAGEVRMGEEADFILQPGECAYVPTGGMLPAGADACVMTEYCEEFGGLETAVYYTAACGENVVETGEDMQEGAKVLSRGDVIRPQTAGVLAALGITAVPVYVPWSLTIISTGDELVSPEIHPRPGQVRDINTYGIYAQAEKLKLSINNYFVIKDDKKLLVDTAKSAMEHSDIVVISGGSSKGKKDVTKEVIQEIASEGVFTHGLALKPGKPTILGYDKPTQTFFAGLPGHPAAAMLVFELLIKWLWQEKTGKADAQWIPAVLSTNIPGAPGKRTCQLVRLVRQEGEPEYEAVPIWGKSGLIYTLASADGYIMIEEDKEGCKKGERVAVYLLD